MDLVQSVQPIAQAPHHRPGRNSPCRIDHWPRGRTDRGKEKEVLIHVSRICYTYLFSSRHSNLALPTSNGGPYKGDLTYYNPALGACGYTNSDSDKICAVSHVLFDAASTGSNPNANPLCGLKLRLRRNGRSVDVKVVDRCVGCAETDLDVTEAVFEEVANLDQGRVLMEWAWLEKSPVTRS